MPDHKMPCGDLWRLQVVDAACRVLQQRVIEEAGEPDGCVVVLDRTAKEGRKVFDRAMSADQKKALGGDKVVVLFVPTWMACDLLHNRGLEVPPQIVNCSPTLRRAACRVIAFGRPGPDGRTHNVSVIDAPSEGWTGEMPNFVDGIDVEALHAQCATAVLGNPTELVMKALASSGVPTEHALSALSGCSFLYLSRAGKTHDGTRRMVESFTRTLLHQLEQSKDQ